MKTSLMVYTSFLAVLAVQDNDDYIQYRVISSLNQTLYRTMAVVVDNTTYRLDPYKEDSILHTTLAPIAQTGYYYIKLEAEGEGHVSEPFLRASVREDTPYEFFNRSWNTHNNYRLPQVYPPLPTVHRVASNLHRDNEIPTIHISGIQEEFDKMHQDSFSNATVTTAVHYLSLTDSLEFEDVKFRISGRLARTKKKLSYRLKLKKEDDLYGYRTVKLRAISSDPSYVREQVAYDVVQSAGLVTTGISYVRLIINQQEVGLFSMIESLGNPWLANVFADADGDYQQGPLYSAVYQGPNPSALKSDLTYYSNLSIYAEGVYRLRQKAAQGSKSDFTPLQTLTRLIDQAPTEGANATDAWKSFLDIDSVLRSLALEVLLGNTDGYISKMNNYYIYRVPETEKYMWIPMDLDLSLGKRFRNSSEIERWSGDYSQWSVFHTRTLTKKMMMIPEFRNTFEFTIQKLNQELIDPQYTFARIDSITEMIREDVAWDKTCVCLGPGSSDKNPSWAKNPTIDPYMSFDEAVNSTVIIQQEISVKLWLQGIYQNTTRFYSQRASQSYQKT